MKKYAFLAAIVSVLFLTSCTSDESESDEKGGNFHQIDQTPVLLDDLTPPSEPVKTKGKDD